jgi:hypothetical protein
MFKKGSKTNYYLAPSLSNATKKPSIWLRNEKNVKRFMLYGRPIKTVLDFEVKFFGHCSITFRFCNLSLIGAPIGFYIIQNRLNFHM